jgi:hypothetical protein
MVPTRYLAENSALDASRRRHVTNLPSGLVMPHSTVTQDTASCCREQVLLVIDVSVIHDFHQLPTSKDAETRRTRRFHVNTSL